MFMNVMVGIDEESHGRDAIALARRLADPDGRRRYVHPLRGVSLGAELHRMAERHHADLIVVGSTSRGRLGRVFLGDLISDALNAAPCAVAIAPLGYAEHEHDFGEIGVAYNGSEESRNALEVAQSLAHDLGTRLSAFEALEMPVYATPAGKGAVGIFDDVTGEDLASARRRIVEVGGDIEAYASWGEPVRQLAIYSDSVDLLVAGSRGYGPIGRLVHGSTTRRLVRVARCPLLILTRGSAGTTDELVDDPRDRVLAQ